MVDQQRRVGEQRAHLGALVVQHPQRVDPRAPFRVALVERQPGQELLQPLAVGGPGLGVAQRRELQPVAGEAQRLVALVGDGDDLGVQRRVVDADRLDPDLL